MDKKNYQTPTAEAVKLQSACLMQDNSTQHEAGGGNSRAFNGNVEDDEEETPFEQ